MQQKLVMFEGISIAYVEKNNNATKTIFFFHGNSLSAKLWYKQFSSPLFSNYRLVAFDLPAHGESGASAQPFVDYSVLGLGRVMASLVNQLHNNKPYTLVGLSLGTNVIAEMLAYQLYPSGIVLAASCIFGGDITLDKLALPDVDLRAAYTDNPDKNLVNAYFGALCISKDTRDQKMIEDDYFAVRLPFRSELLESLVRKEYSNEIFLLQKQNIPTLLIFGKDERLLNIDYLDEVDFSLWANKIFKIPGAGHLTNIDQPEVFNRLLADYLDGIF